jgi:Kef-type K+ transport system membrane component KefB
VAFALGLDLAPAVLVGAAVMSPSVGYITTALEARSLREDLMAWIKQKAIVGELMAIAVVVVFANTESPRELGLGLGALAAILVAAPLLILVFHRAILPWAPRTEFPFLLILALFAAYLTHDVGVHYLAGAFLVGVVARRYLDWIGRHALESASVDEALVAFRFFAGFFIPFLFFIVGVRMPVGALTVESAVFAATLVVIAVPLRLLPTLLLRGVALGERRHDAMSVALYLVPTTVFTFAVAELLRERFELAPWVYGGLVAYGAATSLVPLLAPGSPVESGSEIVDLATQEVLQRKPPPAPEA